MQYAKFSSVVTVVTVLVLAVPAAAQFGPLDQPGGPPEAAVATYQDTSGALPGGQARIAVVIEIPEGWHINAHEPLDEFLIPTRVTLEPPEGFTVAGMAYPEPLLATFSFSQDKMAVYEHSAAIGLVVISFGLKIPFVGPLGTGLLFCVHLALGAATLYLLVVGASATAFGPVVAAFEGHGLVVN